MQTNKAFAANISLRVISIPLLSCNMHLTNVLLIYQSAPILILNCDQFT